MRMLGKSALITGASKSIGRAIALAFSREGARVAITYRNDLDGALEVIQAINDAGGEAIAVQAEFTDEASMKTAFEDALDFLGKVDILVNNAADYDSSCFLSLEVSALQRLLHAGVVAPVYLTQLASHHMIGQKIQGSILNISSISGSHPSPCRLAHSTTKAALNMATKNMALELRPHGIRVNAIAPGSTPYGPLTLPETVEVDFTLQREGTPEDQARVAISLCTEDGAWITGQVITVDGGATGG